MKALHERFEDTERKSSSTARTKLQPRVFALTLCFIIALLLLLLVGRVTSGTSQAVPLRFTSCGAALSLLDSTNCNTCQAVLTLARDLRHGCPALRPAADANFADRRA